MSAPEAYTPPTRDVSAFKCPKCGAYAAQLWGPVAILFPNWTPPILKGWAVARCAHCENDSVWAGTVMMSPSGGTAPLPNVDLPPDIQNDYEEARAILSRSPRGAAALLRLAIQKLCMHLGEKGRNIDADIASLVQKGLPVAVQQALDTVRVVGNEAVHPGTLDLNDDPAVASALFRLVNFITEKMISEPKEIDALFQSLPEAKLKAIAGRDNRLLSGPP